MNNDKAWVDIIRDTEIDDLVTEQQINDRIKEHLDAIKEHRAEIKRSKRSIENLEFKLKKLKYGDNTVIYDLADKLHAHGFAKPELVKPFEWDNFDSEDSTTREFYYYHRAKRIVEEAREAGISIRKAMKFAML